MMEGGREGRREGGKEGGREGGKEGGREGGKEGEMCVNTCDLTIPVTDLNYCKLCFKADSHYRHNAL